MYNRVTEQSRPSVVARGPDLPLAANLNDYLGG